MKRFAFVRRGPRGLRAPISSGFTLIELSIATSILMIGLVAIVSATSNMHSLRKLTRERVLAQNAMRSVAERIHARSFDLSNTGSENWVEGLIGAYGPGGAIGDRFDVRGLAPVPGSPSVGTIQLLTDETQTDAVLGFEIGLPRDLNGDGDAADVDVTADARIVPILLQVQWRGQSGTITLRHAFYALGY